MELANQEDSITCFPSSMSPYLLVPTYHDTNMLR